MQISAILYLSCRKSEVLCIIELVMDGKMCIVRVRASPSHTIPPPYSLVSSTGNLALRGQQSLPRPQKTIEVITS